MFAVGSARAQISLSLASGSAVKGGSVSLNLALNAPTGGAPASLAWTLSYPPSDVTSFGITPGPVLTTANKTLNCAPSAGSITCLASSMDSSTVGNGVVAVVTATLASGTSSTSDSIPITNALGAYPDGTAATLTSTGATITLNNPVPGVTSLTPSSATAGGTAFSLTVNGTAFVGGSVVNWNGAARTTTYVSATQLTAAIAAADIANAGTAQVTVINPAPGGGTSTAASFAINAANPVPSITSLSPTSATAGGTSFGLTVSGTGFINGSVVNWNGAARTTTFVSATHLTAAIPSTDIARAGTAQVTVFNPAPGGGTSTAVAFPIKTPNPVPAISSLSPTSATAGGAPFSLTVNGTGFINGSVVNWNGASRATTFVSATQLTAAIASADIASSGTAQLTVFNPAPGGGTSTAAAFAINAPNPVPSITALSPSSTTAGGAAFSLTVNGTGFVNGSVVIWNGAARTTTYVSATQLTAAITSADIASSGTAQLTAFNPAPGGGTSTAAAFAINAPNPVPTITTLSPASATSGGTAFSLTVNGTGFVNSSVVNWNGSARTTNYVSANQVTAAIAAADITNAGTGQVTVFNPAPGGGTSTAAAFTINAPNPVPTITSLSPSSATAGGAAFSLTVNGTSFINGSVVNWNGSARTTTYVSATQLTAAVTSADIASAATAQVTVFNPAPGGGTSTASSFTISAPNPVPTITTLSPSNATAGGNAFSLTVNGTGFLSGSVVNWNGSARTTTYVSAAQLTAAIVAADIASAGTSQVTVFNPAPGGGTSTAAAFTINAPNPMPTITSLAPSSATAGGVAFNVTINGTGFVSGSVVNWNGAARATTYVNATQLTAAIAAADIASAGTAQVTVFNPAPGGGTSTASAFTINAPNPVPTITTISPASATAGGVAFSLTVNGTGFVNGSVVNWSGSARNTTYVSATQLTAAITSADIASAATAQVTVFNPAPGGGTSTASSFAVNSSNPVPTLTSLSPASATAGGAAFNLAVNGTGFVNGSVVNWNGTARTTTYVSATQLRAAITALDIASGGTAQVTVFNPAPGGGTSTTGAFTINASNPVPSISSLSPSSATKGGAAFSLTVSGSGFINGSVVNWNGAARTTTYVSATQLKAAITAADLTSTGTAQLTVFNPAPGGGTSTAAAFTISAANPLPTISSLSPSSATKGGAAFSLTVSGTGFVNGSVVNWNGSPRTTTYVSSKRLAAAITSADLATAGTVRVTVFNPAPGGGTSAGVAFAISVGSCGPGRHRCPGTTSSISGDLRSIPAPSGPEPQSASALMGLYCSPRIISAGQRATCELRVASVATAMQIQVAGSSEEIRVPQVIATRPNQTRLTFQVEADPAAGQEAVTIKAATDDAGVSDTIQIRESLTPVLKVPGTQFVIAGRPLGFAVTAVDPTGLPVRLDGSGLPAGASFDPASGGFDWVPSASQSGKFEVTFRATNSAGQSSSAKVILNVRSGAVSVDRSERLICSPGAIASLNGTGFAELGTALSDPSGTALALGRTRAKINGQYVPILSASEERVTFVCPSLDPGTQLDAVVESNAGTTDAVKGTMQAASPMIFSLNGSGHNQGVISFADTNELAMARNFLVPAHPAQPGDEILIWGSGFGLPPTDVPAGSVLVKLGGAFAEVESLRAVPGHAGTYVIQARVPIDAEFGDAVAVQVQVTTPDGRRSTSNEVTLAVEPVYQ